MESTGPTHKSSKTKSQSWAELIGTIIAILTLTLPLLAIAYYSSNQSIEPSNQSTYSLPQAND